MIDTLSEQEKELQKAKN